MARVIVIGAGVGGLSAAAVLARAGLEVKVLEAQVYPGGCAATFYHRGYRFDSGATLAGGFYPGGPMQILGQAAGVDGWDEMPVDKTMVVHMPDGEQIARWADDRRWIEYRRAFGGKSESFWLWQEHSADILWDFALRNPDWPPHTLGEMVHLGLKGFDWLVENRDSKMKSVPKLIADAMLPVSAHLRGASEKLRMFIDGQLLISSQVTSKYANALYGAAALDLPRRGVVHLEGGMGSIASKLVKALIVNGGEIHYRQEATRIVVQNNRPIAVETKRGGFPADIVIANQTPWNLAEILPVDGPIQLKGIRSKPIRGWGAFVVYVGFDEMLMEKDFSLHHQVLIGEPLGEGRSVFLSVSPGWDETRAPKGWRAATISTHTRLDKWWDLYEEDRSSYETEKEIYTDRLLQAAGRVIPGLKDGADLVLPGTPVTYARYTRRARGWVGGFPQTNLFQSWNPRIADGIWMVGDSIFPGQSTAAVALGGLRIANVIMRST